MSLVILLLGLAAYSTSFSGQFIWDDTMLVRDNPLIRNPADVLRFFAADIGAGGGARFGFYRPVQMLTYMMDYALWGLQPGGYHLINALLHVGVALCVMWLGRLLLRSKVEGRGSKVEARGLNALSIRSFHLPPSTFDPDMIPFLAAVLYVVHPVHADAVAYISGRADSLAVLFTLIAVCLYIAQARRHFEFRDNSRHSEARRAEESKRRDPSAPAALQDDVRKRKAGQDDARLLFLMGLSCTLALLSRESAAVQPGLLIAYHFAYPRKVWWKGFWIISGLTGAYLLMRFTVLKFIIAGVHYPTTVAQRLPGFFAAMSGYLRLLFLPFGLHNEYGHPLFTFADPRVIIGILIAAAMIIYALTRRARDPLGVFCIAWFFVTLSPVTNIYPPVNAYMLEHWLYAPSIGFFLIAARFIVGLVESRHSEARRAEESKRRDPSPPRNVAGQDDVKSETLPVVLFVAVVLWLLFLTARQNLVYWQDPLQFYSRTLKFNPSSSKMVYNLGNTYRERGNREPAIYWYRKALELDPQNEDIYNNLAGLYGEAGRYDEAIAALRRSIEINPRLVQAYYNLGITYKDAGYIPEAIAAFRQAVEVQPAYVDPYNEIGVMYSDMKEYDTALAWLNRALRVNPRFAPAYLNAALVYARKGDLQTAAGYAMRARSLGLVSPELEKILMQ